MRPPIWIWALLALVAAGYVVPYVVLSEVHTRWGALLFWVVFGFAVWFVLIRAVARWKVSPGDRAVNEVNVGRSAR